MGSHKTITIKGDGVRKEAKCAGAITPGHLVELDSTSGDVSVHSTAGGNAARAFAVEDDLQGKEISDVYADNSQLLYVLFQNGDEVNALIADGETIVIGDFLESAGDGTLRKHDTDSAGAVEYPEAIVAVAMEAVDMSGSSGADPSGRCRAEIV